MTGLGPPLGNGNIGTGLLVSSLEREQKSLRHGGRHHLATVRGSGAVRMHVNSAQVAESPSLTAADYNPSIEQPLQFGNAQIGPFSSSLSNVRLYSRALNDGEVDQLFARPQL